ncbi:hypothetical protein MYA_2761 [Burkholderia sp. KJ006]|nr:hypothetical protein MYA_2761 [Burkholderia sp. KJ006]
MAAGPRARRSRVRADRRRAAGWPGMRSIGDAWHTRQPG